MKQLFIEYFILLFWISVFENCGERGPRSSIKILMFSKCFFMLLTFISIDRHGFIFKLMISQKQYAYKKHL